LFVLRILRSRNESNTWWGSALTGRSSMKSFRLRPFFALRLSVLLLGSGLLAAAQTSVPLAEAFEGGSGGENVQGSDVLDHYLAATQSAQASLRGTSMQVEIDAKLPKLKKQGSLKALRSISQVGRVTYRMLGFSGDTTIKKDVIARYLSAEVQASGNGTDLGITPANYKFKFRGRQNKAGKEVFVFQVSPKRKDVGLFKGELWVDPATYMPLRESGKFVKNPSIFFKKMEFVRTYNIENGVAVPQHIDSVVATRIIGPVELSINFLSTAVPAETQTSDATGSAVQ